MRFQDRLLRVVTPGSSDLERWVDAVLARHTRDLARAEFLKAVRALSARYVERRSDLPDRSPIDSAGKRAAFAAFFAPLHLYTVLAMARELTVEQEPTAILDLGCGTGVSSAAWVLAHDRAAVVEGFDRNAWSLTEAAWNWRFLGIRARGRRADLVDVVDRLAARRPTPRERALVLLAWSVNELAAAARRRLLPALLEAIEAGAMALVIEPVSRSATPWWPEWSTEFTSRGGRQEEWSLEIALPPALRELDEAAGFQRDRITAKTLSVGLSRGQSPRPAA